LSATGGAGQGARAVLLCADLLFGSKVSATLEQAGCEVVCVNDADAARAALPGAVLLVADLSDDSLDALGLIVQIRATDGDAPATAPRTLGYYQHVDDDTRRRALDAGFDAVVPRSKLFREGPQLVSGLLNG
jgi:CheY-like chemotaxis protein